MKIYKGNNSIPFGNESLIFFLNIWKVRGTEVYSVRGREAKKMCSCCVSKLNSLNRLFNVLLCLVGLMIAGWGLYLCSLAEWKFQLTIVTITATGASLALLCGTFSFYGHKRTWFLRFYNIVLSILLLANLVLTGVCLNKDALDQIINDVTALAGPSATAAFKKNIAPAGYIIAGVSALELLSLFFAYCRRSQLLERAKDFEDFGDTSEDDYALLENGKGLRRKKKKGRVELPGESELTGDKAQDRYRQKYAHLYEKYGISKA